VRQLAFEKSEWSGNGKINDLGMGIVVTMRTCSSRNAAARVVHGIDGREGARRAMRMTRN
jgi:hypothetical protein